MTSPNKKRHLVQFSRKVACSRSSDSGERCEVKKAMNSFACTPSPLSKHLNWLPWKALGTTQQRFVKASSGRFRGPFYQITLSVPPQNPQLFAQATNFPNLGKPGYLTLLWLSKLKACPFPRASVILCWKSCKCPTAGLKNRVQMPHPGTTPKLHFPASKLQIPLFIGNL